MKRCLHIFAITLYLLASVAALAQTSSYSSMTMAGDWQGFNPGANNMYLVSNNVWEGTFFISARETNRFKFAANGNWSVNWGENNQTNFTDPFTGTAEPGAGENNIIHRNVRDGFYRIRFNPSTLYYQVALLDYSYGPAYSINVTNGIVASSANLLRNSDFEAPGSSDEEARYWQSTSAWSLGGRWGNSGRRDWRFLSPSWEGAIGAQPLGFGGFWQDVPAGVGFDYTASGSFWADQTPPYGPWTSAVQELKIEFYGPSYGSPLRTVSTNIIGVVESWKNISVKGTAPAGTAWARMVLNVSGAGAAGSLQFDDLTMKGIPYPSQNFDTWTFATNQVGTHARGGWVATNAIVPLSTDSNILWAVAGLGLALKPGGVLTSPRLDDSIGRITFQYRNRDEDPEGPTNAIQFQVEVSPDGISFTVVSNVLNVVNQSFIQFSKFVNDPSQFYIRIRHVSGTNDLLIDNVLVDKTTPIAESRYQDFTSWTNTSFTNNGCISTGDGWLLCTGRLFSAGAYEAPSALLPGILTTGGGWTNALRSPLLTNGYGTLTFQLARGTNGTGAGTLHIQESANGVAWSTIESIPNTLDTGWTDYEVYLNQPQPRYLRLANVSSSSPAGSSLLVSEGFAAGASAPPGWTFSGTIETYTSAGNFGEASPSLKLDGSSNERIITPILSNPTGVTFWAKGQSVSGGSLLKVEAAISGSLTTIGIITNLPGTAITNSFAVPNTATNIQFSYTKFAGNVSFDDVKVYGLPGGAQPAQDLLLDNISVAIPEEFRTQNFDSWPTKNTYGSGTFVYQGWRITNAIVNQERAYDGQSLRLNTTTDNFIESPFFPEGVGLLSFQHRTWTTTTANVAIQYSTNRSAWVTVTNLTTASPDYAYYELLMPTGSTGCWIRLLHNSGSVQVFFDEIVAAKPQPPADVSIVGYTSPEAPYTNDSVYLQAIVSPFYGAKITDVTSFYRVGTNGAFTALSMTVSNFVTYSTANAIPPQTNGVIVQYYMRVNFTGPGASLTSPRYYPSGGSTNPAFYGLPRAKPGQVWINEVRYDDSLWGTNPPPPSDFIELAGPTNFNLSGWRIEVYNRDSSGVYRSAYYVIPTTTLLPPDAPPMGFWVLGGTTITNRDMAMTNALWLSSPANAGIALRNEVGGIEQALCFGANISTFTRVFASDDSFNPEASVWLSGTGLSYSAFSWQEPIDGGTSYRTPGAINQGQLFGEPSPETPPYVWISRMIMTTNVMVWTSGNTNANPWTVAPYYASTLGSNVTWVPVSPFFSAYGSGTNTIWFDRPTNAIYFIQMRFAKP